MGNDDRDPDATLPLPGRVMELLQKREEEERKELNGTDGTDGTDATDGRASSYD